MAEAYETERDDAAPAPDGPGLFRQWKRALDAADKKEQDWRKTGMSVVEKYRDQKRQGVGNRTHRFNILWSNTEVQSSAVFQGNIQPDIRRRFRTADPLGKEMATAIERCLAYQTDEGDTDNTIRRIVQDMLLPGRGVARVQYDYTPGPDGTPIEEMAPVRYVDWRWFRMDPDADRWEDVTWIAFGGEKTREQLVADFGPEIGNAVGLDAQDTGEDGEPSDGDDGDVVKAARVWEIWCKNSRKVKFWAAGYPDGLLGEMDPPVDLRGFYPCPRPVYAVETNDTLIPVPEYELWRDQAAELNKVTDRIDKVVDALRVRGVYPASDGAEIARLFQAEDNDLIPVENWPALLEKGGLDSIIQWLPIDMLQQVLESLYVQRESIKQTIYEITGISDILRGASDARETATAQEIKSKFGSLRIERKRQEINRFVRDLMEIQAEIIAEAFSPQTISQMTGMDLPFAEQKAQAQEMVQMAEQAQQPPPPDAVAMLSRPSWEEILDILRRDKLRSYRIDIETEDSLQVQSETEKAAVIELLGGLANFAEGAGAIVQSGLFTGQEIKAVAMAAVRRFKLGKDVENALEEGAAQAEQMQGQEKPDPEVEAAKAKAEAEQAKAQMEMQKLQGDMELAQAKGSIEMQTMQAKAQADAQRITLETQSRQAQHQLDMERIAAEMAKLRASVEMAREKGAVDREMLEARARQQRSEARREANG